MPCIDSSKIPQVQMREGVIGKFLADARTGARGLTVLLNIVEPGASIPLHRHRAEESGIVLEGEIWALINDERFTVTPDRTIVFPAGEPHAWGNSGAAVARVVWVWNSADPFGDSVYIEGEPPRK
jgi:quercetin dioxygenase-like cupin family protein